MQTDKTVPYPNPDYSDPDLLAKEEINGSFSIAVIDEVKHFRPAMERYEGTVDDLKNSRFLRGKYDLQSVDMSFHSFGTDYIKQLSWQPLKVPYETPEPEIVYDPLKHYNHVEYHGLSSRDTGATFIKGLYCSTPYYDPEDPGLFGARSIKDADGNIVGRYTAFVSLLDFSPLILGEWPEDVNFDSRAYVGYVKGYAVYRCYVSDTEDELISFGLDGSVHRFGPVGKQCRSLGEYGCLVATSMGKTLILDGRLAKVTEIDGDWCSSNISEAASPVPYPFGVKIGRSFYYVRTDESSWKYTKTKKGWHISKKEHPIWKFSKMVKYDYVTDNWMHEPLKAMRWNLIRHGVSIPTGIPTKRALLKSSDNYGDFIETDDGDGTKKLYHTFDFRKWNEVTDSRAVQRFYGMMGRIWIKPGLSDITGMLPYTIAFFDQNDKMIFQFDGFVFSMS